jgi:hypothetical protein
MTVMGLWPRASRSGGLQAACEAGEQGGLWAGCSECDANPAGCLGDTRGDFQQPHPQRGELCPGQGLRLGNGVTEFQHHPIGAGVQDEAARICER